MTSVIPTVTLADVESAREGLRGVARETPLRPARWLAEQVGGPVELKCENLQRAGSFKIRGAYTRMSRLTEEERARGVVAASAGNHAQGVALAAQMLGIRATVFMPVGAPIPKVTATRGYGAEVRIVGVQAAGAAAYPLSLEAHHPVQLPSMSTMADGIAVGRPGDVPFLLVEDLVDDVLVVDDAAIARALVQTLERGKLVVEPAGAAGLAAVMTDPTAFEPPVVVVVSGGNVDPLLLLRVVRHGLAAAGRFSTLTVRVPDRPGSLAGLLAALADSDANVVEVEHARLDPALSLDEVEIEVQVETRGPAHRDEVVAGLEAAGFRVVVT